MPEEKMSPSSPQLAIVEHQGVAVALSAKEVASIYKKSRQSGIPFDTLEEVYRRGYSAWTPELNETPTQTAFDRVNSFIAEGAAAAMDSDLINEKRGLWDNIHAKRERIKHGSGERMRKPGEKGAPTAAALKAAQEETEINEILIQKGKPFNPKKLSPAAQKEFNKYVTKHTNKMAHAEQEAGEKPSKSFKHYNTQSGDYGATPSKMGLRHSIGAGYYGKEYNEERYMGAEKRSNDPNNPASRFDGDARVYIASTPGQESNLKHVEGGSKLKTIKRVVKEKECSCQESVELEEKWSDAKHKSPSGGLTRAGVMAYRRENPGSKLQTAVTTKPSKLKKGSKAAKRRKSFCARMGGMKKRLTSAKTARDPDSRINKALRKWHC